MARCGTTSGYSAHQKKGEKPCDACALAKKEYDKRWRAASNTTIKSRLSAKAQRLAFVRLMHEHPGEYERYYDEFKKQVYEEAGLPAPKKIRRRAYD